MYAGCWLLSELNHSNLPDMAVILSGLFEHNPKPVQTLEGADRAPPLPNAQGSPVRSVAAASSSQQQEVIQLSGDLRRGASITQSAGGNPLPQAHSSKSQPRFLRCHGKKVV